MVFSEMEMEAVVEFFGDFSEFFSGFYKGFQ